MALQLDKIFVNLPVKNLKNSIEFFSNIGFAFNPQFTGDNATCMVISDHIYVMLLVEPYYQTFIKKEIADASKTNEVIVCVSAESREQVDEIVNKALEAGGKPSNDKQDHGFMYCWSFQDLDNHLWEVTYMDPSALQGQ